METWFFLILTAFITVAISSLITIIIRSSKPKLPPGPTSIPVLSSLLWIRKSFAQLEAILITLSSKYGPILTLRIGSQPAIFISDHSLAHKALVQNGTLFSSRPPPPPAAVMFSSNQHNISSAAYGPTWRILRRNLTSEMLNANRVKSYSSARRWILHDLLINRFNSSQSQPICLIDHIQFAMFGLLVLMCFGDKLDESKIREIEAVQRRGILAFGSFNILNFFPRFGKILFRSKWRELKKLRYDQESILIPHIRSRAIAKERKSSEDVFCYVDSLLDIHLPEEKRKLSEDEMVSLCSEFLNAGTDTTSTALQWIMANLVKYQNIQQKLYEEITSVVESETERDEIREDELHKMSYLRAVVLEGLRRHPPGHFVLAHAVSEEVAFEGYVVPKNASINFMVGKMGLDPKVWEDPMEFRPERFMVMDEFDITGSREIKMMPFGVGRRICPGWGLALLHLEYFVANFVWNFKWTGVDGEQVDLTEKQEFTVVMKHPLRAHASPRQMETEI